MVGTDEAEIQGLGLSMSYGEKLYAPAKIFFLSNKRTALWDYPKELGDNMA